MFTHLREMAALFALIATLDVDACNWFAALMATNNGHDHGVTRVLEAHVAAQREQT